VNRVQVDRIVLRPAEWRLFKSAGVQKDADAFKAWCTDWDVPRSLCLTFADNRLILNLEVADHTRILLAEWRRWADNQSLLVQEVLPSLEDVWLKGEEGRYYSEFTIRLHCVKSVQFAIVALLGIPNEGHTKMEDRSL
jgi:hypothetical protein